jgi:hypothetical protein
LGSWRWIHHDGRVGPNRAALILEVGYIEGDVAIVIVHAMIAREKFLG